MFKVFQQMEVVLSSVIKVQEYHIKMNELKYAEELTNQTQKDPVAGKQQQDIMEPLSVCPSIHMKKLKGVIG